MKRNRIKDPTADLISGSKKSGWTFQKQIKMDLTHLVGGLTQVKVDIPNVGRLESLPR